MTVSMNFPIVGDTTSIGDAARAAAEENVGAVIVANPNGLWVMPISSIPEEAHGEIGSLIGNFAKRLEPPGFLPQTEFSLQSILKGLAQIDFDPSHPWQLNIVHGYKECDVNPKHTYPPKYRSSDCPSPNCTGTLWLR